MASLYQLTQSALVLNDLLESGDITEEAIKDAILNNNEDIADKLEGYARFIKNLETDIAGYKAEEKRLSERRKTMENTIDRMKDAMKEALKASGEPKVKAENGLFTFSIKKNPPKVEIDNPEKIPTRYFIEQLPKLDNKALLDDLKSEQVPEDLAGVAHLSQGDSISIR